jgi:hypothetical protein
MISNKENQEPKVQPDRSKEDGLAKENQKDSCYHGIPYMAIDSMDNQSLSGAPGRKCSLADSGKHPNSGSEEIEAHKYGKKGKTRGKVVEWEKEMPCWQPAGEEQDEKRYQDSHSNR